MNIAARTLLVGLATLFWSGLSYSANIALVIDDLGNTHHDSQALALPTGVTFAILPNRPFSRFLAKQAAKQQRQVIVHMPMEPLTHNNPGGGAILADMRPSMVVEKLQEALADVPNAVGINNHMGSKLTQLTLPMTATMKYLHQRGMLFLDSRTTRYSKAEKIARKYQVPLMHRNVFIDNSLSEKRMNNQLQRLVRIARKYHHAIGIAHPHPRTLAFLRKALPILQQQGIDLVPLSQLYRVQPQIIVANRKAQAFQTTTTGSAGTAGSAAN